MSIGHCRAAITAELSAVPGVQQVDVDLETKLVQISGNDLGRGALVGAIEPRGAMLAARSNEGRRRRCGGLLGLRDDHSAGSFLNPRCAKIEQR